MVAKEKERLQSELEIAREVQNQLFPRAAPDLKSLRLTGVCNPARTVSGDYYDFMPMLGYEPGLRHRRRGGQGNFGGAADGRHPVRHAHAAHHRHPRRGGARATAAVIPVFSTARLVSMLNKQLYANTSPEKFATFYFALYDDISQHPDLHQRGPPAPHPGARRPHGGARGHRHGGGRLPLRRVRGEAHPAHSRRPAGGLYRRRHRARKRIRRDVRRSAPERPPACATPRAMAARSSRA